MKKIVSTLFSLSLMLSLFSFLSCQRDDKDMTYINTDTSEIIFTPSQLEKNIKIETSTDWIIEGPNKQMYLGAPVAQFNWIAVDPVLGNGAKSISVKVVEGSSAKEKDPIVITIKSQSKSKNISIKFDESQR